MIKKIVITALLALPVFKGLAANGEVPVATCVVAPQSDICVDIPVTFTSDCGSEFFDLFEWYIDDVLVETQTGPSVQPELTRSFSSPGTHTVKLGSWCQDENDCSLGHMLYSQITVNVFDVQQPVIQTTGLTQYCETGSVSMSIQSPEAGLTYSWTSTPGGFSATGTSVNFTNITTTTQFHVKASTGMCQSEERTQTVTIYKTSLTPALDPSTPYHKRILTTLFASSHYWQTAATNTDLSVPVSVVRNVYVPGDYFIRQYVSSLSCWTNATGPVHIGVDDINYTPPVAVVAQVQKPGYNEVIFISSEKTHVLTYATYYWVKDASADPEIVRPFNNGLTPVGNKLFDDGTYYLKGKDNDTGTWGPTLTIAVELRGDEGLNWIHSKAFDGTVQTVNGQQVPTVVAESKAYFDDAGKGLQAQAKNLSTGKILTSQELHDKYDRVVGATLPAPINGSDFNYNGGFILASSGALYDHKSFDWTSLSNPNDNTVYNPVEVNDDAEGTVGWYYSDNNNLESHVPTTKFPYTRTEYYTDGTGDAKRSAGVGEVHRLGAGHEILSGTFPVVNELSDYLAKRLVALPGIVQDGSLKNEGVVNVGKDANGKVAVSITDKEGKTVLVARKGTLSDNVLSVTNTITSSGALTSPDYRPMTYFYLLDDFAVTVTGSSDFVAENLVTGERKASGMTFAGVGGVWPAGFYRILVTAPTSEVTITYANYFQDVSYQFYDDAGRLRSSVSPNGYKEWITNPDPAVKYPSIDKTTYQYNFRGWLVQITEPDAGTTKYQYRKDGKIRFSQNAQQAADHHFSYTHYDRLGRPVESGEYVGTQYTYDNLSDQLEYADQVLYENTVSVTNTRDWLKTYYDYAAGDLDDDTHLPASYVQNFVRAGVSTSENINIKIWYSYDELGRVTWMAQKPKVLPRVFVVKYTYDFLGNVLTVANLSYDLNGNVLEQFYHHYEYDADKRLSKAYTSLTETGSKKLRATYTYYLHGPLKRIELGDNLQGIDFVYNIQGWLTQINHPDPAQDPGGDGNDVFGMVLDYYESDMPNLLSASGGSPHDPIRRHRFPSNAWAAVENHPPLIRFKPDAAETNENSASFKVYSAENPAYKNMMQAQKHNSTN